MHNYTTLARANTAYSDDIMYDMWGQSKKYICTQSSLANTTMYSLRGSPIQQRVHWDSGFQWTHIQIFGESQFYITYFLLGLLLKWDFASENHSLGTCLEFWISADAYTNFRGISVLYYIFSIRAFAEMWLLTENHILGTCLGFWISADACTNFRWISVLYCIFSIRAFGLQGGV